MRSGQMESYAYGINVFVFFLVSSFLVYYSGSEKAREREETYEKLLEKMRDLEMNTNIFTEQLPKKPWKIKPSLAVTDTTKKSSVQLGAKK